MEISAKDIYYSIFNSVENDKVYPIENIKLNIEKYNNIKKKNLSDINEKVIKYIEIYDNPRIQSENNYNEYVYNRNILYNIWKENPNKQNVYNLINFEKPELNDIPEIYTYTVIQDKREKKEKRDNDVIHKPKVPKPDESKVAKPKIPKKRVCPEGQVINPNTGRCVKINSKALKALKVAEDVIIPDDAPEVQENVIEPIQPKIPKKRVCPEGQVINPNTGRCVKINSKALKALKVAEDVIIPDDAPEVQENVIEPIQPKIPKKRVCPEGQVINPNTGRCVKINSKVLKK